MVGRIKSITRGQATGYIRDEKGRDVFFHKADVLHDGFNDLTVGATVRFEVIDDRVSGARAQQVQPAQRAVKTRRVSRATR